eukprot:3940690-Rhodomonas_salina.4
MSSCMLLPGIAYDLARWVWFSKTSEVLPHPPSPCPSLPSAMCEESGRGGVVHAGQHSAMTCMHGVINVDVFSPHQSHVDLHNINVMLMLSLARGSRGSDAVHGQR